MGYGDAREAMIAAAERLAADHGLGAMSLRAVQVAAGQRNKSAAQFHFGSREGLVDAVIGARMGPIDARRRALLDELGERAGRRSLVHALVAPLAEATARTGSTWARFLAQGAADPLLTERVRAHVAGGSFREVRTRLIDTLDHLPTPLRAGRVDHAVALVVTRLAAAEHAAAVPEPAPLPHDAFVADLVDACVGLLDAPASRATLDALAATTATAARR